MSSPLPAHEAIASTTATPLPEPANVEPEPSFSRHLIATTFRSLRHRNYRLYFFGQLVSLLGSWMQITALNWLAFEITQQSLWVALITTAQILPTFLFGAWGGALADRCSKQKLIFYTQIAFLFQALALAALVLAGSVGPWQLLALALVSGLIQAVDLPARLAVVMDMVGREDIINAVALNAMLFNVARAIGPAIAGWILLLVGPGVCFLANGLSYVPLLVGLMLMRLPIEHTLPRPRSGRSFLDGFRYVGEQPDLAMLLALAGTVALVGWPFQTLLPAFATNTLAVEERGYSLMLSATGFGALLSALAVAARGAAHHQHRFIRAGVIIVAGGLLALSLSTQLPYAVAACALIGFGLILFFSTCQTVLQLSAGDHIRGRIMGIWAMILSGAVPLGNLVSGPAADRWGEPIVMRLQCLACAVTVVALYALKLKHHSIGKASSTM